MELWKVFDQQGWENPQAIRAEDHAQFTGSDPGDRVCPGQQVSCGSTDAARFRLWDAACDRKAEGIDGFSVNRSCQPLSILRWSNSNRELASKRSRNSS